MKTRLMKAVEEYEAEQREYSRDVEAEIARLRKKCEWQKIETAPENAWVLGASDNGTVVAVVMLVVENDERQWFTEPYETADRYHRDGTFTHWMPLPAPPNYCSAAKNEIAPPSNPAPKPHHDAE